MAKENRRLLLIGIGLLVVVSMILLVPRSPHKLEQLNSADFYANAYMSEFADSEDQYKHYLFVASKYFQQGEYSKSLEFYQKAENVFPNDSLRQGEIAMERYFAYKYLDNIDQYKQELEKAISWYSDLVMSTRNTDPYAHIKLAELYEEQGNRELALSEYKRALELLRKTKDQESSGAIEHLEQLISALGSDQ